MAWPNPLEVAVLTVDGTKYTDWESVLVRHALREPPIYYCRFTCSENAPLTENWMAQHIMPGADCTVTLGGLLAFTGKVTTRQVFYDSKRHYIEIQCSNFNEIMLGSVVHDTHEWPQGSTLEKVIRDVLKPAKLNLIVEGGSLPTTPLGVTRAAPGETIFDFIDRLTRAFSANTSIGISFTSNVNNDFVLVVGPTGGTDTVIEGVNILEGRETIYDPFLARDLVAASQGPGSDQRHGATVSYETWWAQAIEGLGNKSNSALIINEMATSNKAIIKGRTTTERNWMQEDMITVFITVQGWMRPSGGLWYRAQTVIVNAPMLVMNGIPLILKTATFTQDNPTGTRTVLELVNANVLAGLTPTERD